MGNSSTGLPPEVVSQILWHLGPPALRRCLRVNSSFNALAQRPLAACVSAYVAADGKGMTFPHIKESTAEQKKQQSVPQAVPPFVPQTHASPPITALSQLYRPQQNPAPGQSSAVPKRIPENLRCLTVGKHWRCYPGSRTPFAASLETPIISSCRVLKVLLASPDDRDHIASPHSDYFPLSLSARLELSEVSEDDTDIPYEYVCVLPLECQLLHFGVKDADICKLVLRNVPLVFGNVDPGLLPLTTSHRIQEAVIAFNLYSMSSSNGDAMESWYGGGDDPICSEAPEELAYPAIGSIGSGVPPNVESLTFVFWTYCPEEVSAPPCCYVRELWDCMEEEEHHLDEDGDRESEPPHESCWEEGFWRELAVAVAPLFLRNLRQLTIVNASSIVPTGAPPQATLELMSSGLFRHDVFETKFRVQLYDHLCSDHSVTPDKARECVGHVKFKYTKDWLLFTDWDDVFSWSEVRPWLEFKRPALITDYFKPVDAEAAKWRSDMNKAERYHLEKRRKKYALS
ncbi:hypothetical protein A1Q1_05868 [Trichosporon asahii var. asahii CBS 2479]|uniref:F-box domain-containing protein n=1 Tax=Trichosporon asahii var. asahii (strain ATCC 90039 / CBS 2479 / JCM 2466 / KCTC 7840 / NBRC 103889/ NCYC 2677 / UAMH 7654) TaxID=1186058 RepID=J6EN12_TRIAS|nr:hypothetical protein A1Q1_05868 [Trichosporon asahii var. asahii CBS 2479]EJT45719.1 hypothetical protein A1Q1_05868 [Trichosporon asahii var. asahii CBS 2479]